LAYGDIKAPSRGTPPRAKQDIPRLGQSYGAAVGKSRTGMICNPVAPATGFDISGIFFVELLYNGSITPRSIAPAMLVQQVRLYRRREL
jgi:hypothetical protein